MSTRFDREIVSRIYTRLETPPPLVQVVVGPRQVGKTTAAHAVADRWNGPVHYAAADVPLPPGPEWVESHWRQARRLKGEGATLLVLDEVQKVKGWSETVKALWDEERRGDSSLQVLLLGSSALLLAKGATESLAGRFFLHRCTHWSYPECRAAFGWDLDQWLYFGGYPGAAALTDEESAWRSYVVDSLIETVLARDVLAMQTVAKPTLLRHLFVMSARFPSRILSYNKMLGQLQDAGNTTTLAHYLRLLETAFLISGLERFSLGKAKSRGSSPKLVLWNNALVNALGVRSFEQVQSDPAFRGRLVENAVGAHLVNHLRALRFVVTYWRERNAEVDYVVQGGETIRAIEVKSGRPNRPRGLEIFRKRYPGSEALVVGSGGVSLETFFSTDPESMLGL